VIISHKHRFIFFAVPKTATHALRQTLRQHLGDGDWEQQMLFGKQSIPVPEIAAIGHGHISWQQIRSHLPKDLWDTYFKFGFVRNPFDRFVSTCFFLNRDNINFKGREVEFMQEAIHRKKFQQRILVVPQSHLLVDENSKVMMDYVGRFEELQPSYDDICKHIGIPSAKLSSKNISHHDNYSRYYDMTLQKSVAEFYQSDFEVFGYNPLDSFSNHES
jgi:hypothetical protein